MLAVALVWRARFELRWVVEGFLEKWRGGAGDDALSGREDDEGGVGVSRLRDNRLAEGRDSTRDSAFNLIELRREAAGRCRPVC